MLSAQETFATIQDTNVEDIVPGRLSHTQWNNMLMQQDTDDTVGIILEELLNRVMEGCLKIDVKRQLVPFSVYWAKKQLIQLMEDTFSYRDDGDEPEEALRTEDIEPAPATVDDWAQGCVPILYAAPPPTSVSSTSKQGAKASSDSSSSPKQQDKEKMPTKAKGDKRLPRFPQIEGEAEKIQHTRPELSMSGEIPGQTKLPTSLPTDVMTPKQLKTEKGPRAPTPISLPILQLAQNETRRSRLPLKRAAKTLSSSLPASSQILDRMNAKAESRTSSSLQLYPNNNVPIERLRPSRLPRHIITPLYEIVDSDCARQRQQRFSKHKTVPLIAHMSQSAKFQM